MTRSGSDQEQGNITYSQCSVYFRSGWYYWRSHCSGFLHFYLSDHHIVRWGHRRCQHILKPFTRCWNKADISLTLFDIWHSDSLTWWQGKTWQQDYGSNFKHKYYRSNIKISVRNNRLVSGFNIKSYKVRVYLSC